jgi:site-specific DNA recombinase
LETSSSNHEKGANEALTFAENISKTWGCGSYMETQRLQYFLFPNGIRYNKKSNEVRTEKYNPLFLWIARQQQDGSQKKSGIPELNLSYAALVAPEIQNSNEILEDTRVLAQIWGLYGTNIDNI